MALGYLGRGSGDRGVASGSDVNRVEVLGDSTVEVAERQSGPADQPNPRDLAGIPQRSDEFSEADDDVIAFECGRHRQTLAKVSRQTSTPRLANSSGTSESGGMGSAASTPRP